MKNYYSLNVPRDTWDGFTKHCETIKGFTASGVALWLMNLCVETGMSPYKGAQTATMEPKKRGPVATKEKEIKINDRFQIKYNNKIYNFKLLKRLFYDNRSGESVWSWEMPEHRAGNALRMNKDFAQKVLNKSNDVDSTHKGMDPEWYLDKLLKPLGFEFTDDEEKEDAYCLAEDAFHFQMGVAEHNAARYRSDKLREVMPEEEEVPDF